MTHTPTHSAFQALSETLANKNTTISLPELVSDIKQLGLLLAMETDYLRDMQVENVKAIQDEKLRLVRKLELQKKLIAYNPGVLIDRTAQGVEELKQAQNLLNGLMAENMRELYKAREVNRLVVDAIVETVEEHLQHNHGYNARGFSDSATGRTQDMPALTLSEMI